MSKINDGGPAFPTDGRIQHGTAYDGMSLRDWFAGQAFPAIIAATSAGQHQPTIRNSGEHIIYSIARDAYVAADAMLAELTKAEGADK